jgi:hypothetical protein
MPRLRPARKWGSFRAWSRERIYCVPGPYHGLSVVTRSDPKRPDFASPQGPISGYRARKAGRLTIQPMFYCFYEASPGLNCVLLVSRFGWSATSNASPRPISAAAGVAGHAASPSRRQRHVSLSPPNAQEVNWRGKAASRSPCTRTPPQARRTILHNSFDQPKPPIRYLRVCTFCGDMKMLRLASNSNNSPRYMKPA